jgi:hypothetical protein
MPFYKKKGYVFSHSGNTYKFTEENFNNKYCNNKNKPGEAYKIIYIIKNKIIAALQVRSDNKRYKKNLNSKLKSCKRVYIKASLTIETALSLSIFIFAAALMMLPFRMMETSRKMQALCEAVNEDAAKYAYAVYIAENKGILKDEPEIIRSAQDEQADNSGKFKSLLSSSALGEYTKSKAAAQIKDSHIQNISWTGTECMAENGIITIRITYNYKLPFALFGLGDIKQQVLSSRRAWIGSEGDSEYTEGETDKEDDETVYVGKTSTRYHRDRRCHYLYNDIKAVPKTVISDHRNTSGGKYSPCARCGAAVSDTVYIMPSGNSYHSTRNCSAINAYVRAVKKSEVEYLGECSYCGRRH